MTNRLLILTVVLTRGSTPTPRGVPLRARCGWTPLRPLARYGTPTHPPGRCFRFSAEGGNPETPLLRVKGAVFRACSDLRSPSASLRSPHVGASPLCQSCRRQLWLTVMCIARRRRIAARLDPVAGPSTSGEGLGLGLACAHGIWSAGEASERERRSGQEGGEAPRAACRSERRRRGEAPTCGGRRRCPQGESTPGAGARHSESTPGAGAKHSQSTPGAGARNRSCVL